MKNLLAIRVSTRLARLGCLALALLPAPGPPLGAAEFPQVPGVVIDHLPASAGLFVGSPSIAVWTNGDYVASHDIFGPNSTEHTRAVTLVFRSRDRGLAWRKAAAIDGQFWSSLFVNHGALYLLGTDRHHGNAVIRRSLDGGETWTTPADAASGLLRADAEYHCAPTPVIEHAGRLWRGLERRIPPSGWGGNYCAGVISAPASADLLNAVNWTFSDFLPSSRTWNGGDMGGWLEGNVAVTPAGELLDILRVDTAKPPERAALVSVSPDGKTLRFDPATGFINLPGGAKKFTIRQDPKGDGYWTLASIVPAGADTPPSSPLSEAKSRLVGIERSEIPTRRDTPPSEIRNTLALLHSEDLRQWNVCRVLLHHPDAARHAFQYVDWQFDGDDLVAACRTAYDDDQGGAHNGHDANFLTFHRIQNFRSLAATAPGVQRALRLAVVQQAANPGKPEENRNKALGFASQALEQGAEVVLFHEEMLVGCVKNLRELAEPLDGPTTRAFQNLLRGSQALIIYGLTEREGDKYFISATVVSANGVVTNYHKTHLWWNDEGARCEPAFYQPGDRLVTFNVKGARCGLMICYDGDFPEMTRAYANLGCSVLFWMNNRPSRGYAEVKDLAYRNSMIMATSCCCGTDELGRVCRGGSNITDATGKLLSEIWDREGLMVSEVLPDKVAALRAKNPWFRGQRQDLYR